MSPRGTKQRPSFTKVAPKSVSPDDVLKLIQERDQSHRNNSWTNVSKKPARPFHLAGLSLILLGMSLQKCREAL
jgi:hypothetical protein